MKLRYFQIILTITLGLASAFPFENTHGLPHILPRTNPFQHFKFVGCSSDEQKVIKAAYSTIHDMVNSQQKSLSHVKDYLNKMLSDHPPALTAEIENQLNSFMTFFGPFDYADDCDIANNIAVASQVVDTVRLIDKIMLDYLLSGQYAPSIFCGDDAFQYVRTEGDTKYYKNTEDPDKRQIAGDTGSASGKCDGQSIAAIMMSPTTGKIADWLLLCPDLIRKWLEGDSDADEDSDLEGAPDPRSLSDYKKLDLEDMLDRPLDEIMSHTPEGTLLHELTHSRQIFTIDNQFVSHGGNAPDARVYRELERTGQLGKALNVDAHGNYVDTHAFLHDVEVAPGIPAYEFEKVVDLAKVSRNQPLRMVQNAETIAYHAAAVYLSQCKWNEHGDCVEPDK